MAAESFQNKKNRPKIGLALGSGAARGLAHLGVLKILHQHKIYPDFVAGTSIGAVIGALYCSGLAPQEIEQLVQTTRWKELADFTLPKRGLIRGRKIENILRKYLQNSSFSSLKIPFRAVAYNLDLNEKAVFVSGDVAKAVRASLSLPGIFTPLKIGKYHYIDGGVINPTPYDVVKEMGADLVIAVDLTASEHGCNKLSNVPVVKRTDLFAELREQFISAQLLHLRQLLIPQHWPQLIQDFLRWFFDKLLYPARILRILTGRELPPIAKTLYETVDILTVNLAQERLKKAEIDILIAPLCTHSWLDFSQIQEFVKIGEKAMQEQLPQLQKIISKRSASS